MELHFFNEAFKIAKENNITQLELNFVEDNNRAKALYEKFGFKIVAIKPNAIRLKDGSYLNEYSMIRPL